jgi:hypothetical protein
VLLAAGPVCIYRADVSESANMQAGDGPADHQLLDLLGALEEVVDPERVFVNIRNVR